jgi:hypothetical protein
MGGVRTRETRAIFHGPRLRGSAERVGQVLVGEGECQGGRGRGWRMKGGGWMAGGAGRNGGKSRSLCQTGAGLICGAFARTLRPRIITLSLSLSISSAILLHQPLVLLLLSRRRITSSHRRFLILHSIPRWINPLMAGSLICARLQNNSDNYYTWSYR